MPSELPDVGAILNGMCDKFVFETLRVGGGGGGLVGGGRGGATVGRPVIKLIDCFT